MAQDISKTFTPHAVSWDLQLRSLQMSRRPPEPKKLLNVAQETGVDLVDSAYSTGKLSAVKMLLSTGYGYASLLGVH